MVANSVLYFIDVKPDTNFLKYTLTHLCTHNLVFMNDARVGKRLQNTAVCNCAKENAYFDSGLYS